jgi:hypothetical protein
VTVVLDDGRRVERSVSRPLAVDAGGRELEGKVADCLAQVDAAAWAPRLFRAVLHEQADVHRPDSELMRGIRSSLMSAIEGEEMQ